MRFMAMVRADAGSEAGHPPDGRVLVELERFNAELARAGVLLAAESLQPSACGARVRFRAARPSVVDGPFAADAGLVAGFWLLQARTLEEAIEWVKRCPEPHGGGEIEIRPVREAGAGALPAGDFARGRPSPAPAGRDREDGAGRDEVVVEGRLYLHPGQRHAYLAACAPMVARARRQPGCLDFSISADTVDPGRVNLIERWDCEHSLAAWRRQADPPQDLPEVLHAEVRKHRVAWSGDPFAASP
ncbi:YciI family protein [Luteimonas sp. RD2P54]|uniref:YciI family protein n=1 Tax=Luteimonas endophytica TaxID=3042023 RepID=A0ABT6JAU9_9GAMM|nr:YciI family protein [Luteimonas endophytica]MDH5823283.1 YciI family protein [Luteimonas endophytica]